MTHPNDAKIEPGEAEGQDEAGVLDGAEILGEPPDPMFGAGVERLSPFLEWSEEARAPVTTAGVDESSLLIQLLQAPGAVAERIRDPQRVQRVTLTAVATTAVCGALSSIVMTAAWGETRLVVLGGLVWVPVGMLGALAASIGPIYGAAVAHSVRMPIAQLVAVLSAAMAAASMILLALSAAPYMLWQLDSEWVGPLSVVGAFFGAALACGIRLPSLLLRLVHVPGDEDPKPGDRQRVMAFVRMAMLVLCFTYSLAGWAWFAAR